MAPGECGLREPHGDRGIVDLDWRLTRTNWNRDGPWVGDLTGVEMSVYWLHLGDMHFAVRCGEYGLAHDADGGPATIGA